MKRLLHWGTIALGTVLGILLFFAILFARHFIHPKVATWLTIRCFMATGTVMTWEEWLDSLK